MEYCSIYYIIYPYKSFFLYIYNSCSFIIFHQNNFTSLLQHLFSSLMMCLLARGRDNLPLTWDPPIANHNHPINSHWTKSSPTFYLVPEDTSQQRRKVYHNFCFMLTLQITVSIYKPNSKKVGTLYKLWIKKECNDVEVSNFKILFRIQHRWHIKCLNWENVSF